MKASELRIGNLIGYCADSLTCDFSSRVIDVEFMILLLDGRCQLDTDCEPMPLTEEWLVRLGFEIRNGYCGNDKITLRWSNNMLSDDSYESIFNINIKYVHQLQNLYFALTGEELVYELNPSNTPTY